MNDVPPLTPTDIALRVRTRTEVFQSPSPPKP
jgi:hypothetical protein